MKERWGNVSDEKSIAILREVLQSGEVMVRKGNKYLVSKDSYYALVEKKKGYWVVLTVTLGSPPIGWIREKYLHKEPPFSAGINIVTNIGRVKPR
jgi:hypothetical protein